MRNQGAVSGSINEDDMPAATCSDAEFIELFKTHQSAAKVADILGISRRAVYDRRRSVEVRHNTPLGATDSRAKQFSHLQPIEYKRDHNLGILNGTVVLFSDAHFWPGERTTAYRGLLHLIRELQPKVVICNGDAFDGARISRYPRIGWDSTPSVVEELKAVEAALGEIEDAAGKAKLIWPLGNHDARFENRLASNAPEFEGVKGFHLKDHFAAWTPCWACWINDNTVAKHRFKGGIGATRNNTIHAGVNIFTGHLHQGRYQPFSDYNGTRYGVDCGTLTDVPGRQTVHYTEMNPLDWRSSFVVATFHDGRLLEPQHAVKWSDGKIEFERKLIDVSSI